VIFKFPFYRDIPWHMSLIDNWRPHLWQN
jgi:hypothetical protein